MKGQPSPVEPDDPTGIRAVTWRDGRLDLLDQRRLPADVRRVVCEDVDAVIHCIRDMVVRGAPAIGVTAAYGAVLAARARLEADGAGWLAGFRTDVARLARARPTAVNLAWAVARMLRAAEAAADGADPVNALLDEARRLHAEDIAMNVAMAKHGANLLETPGSVITHCNAGALATGGLGTALGVIREAWRRGLVTRVWVDETRPWLQGARLTAWELGREGIPATIIADSAAAQVMRKDPPTWAIVGADRVAANGDVVNKIGTYSLAVNARHHGVRFMVVAPTSTLDGATPTGDDVPIEQRDPEELWEAAGGLPAGAEATNPAFDVTPAGLVDALVTERGVAMPPDEDSVAELLRA
ncbi:S-methyl-5-thioribose-1-phosphate isomerase [Wenzhouxiangella sp. XN24]|uniref:S-methyl-5-thioribose-1-phosphate isomerase n=1 Tax=Wenzhouxiangella sp. XN24 TaxID=2713569 RepID=UPI0013ED861A|nr:S-methyl-5-thioribose-1-phosphate isomerase [Wenzhouxiangella sp. XN24]NGX16448.1 S-methyl-5-thioribose-1-phosphate isomerase [Wenzhouxiangella sp. XN24]